MEEFCEAAMDNKLDVMRRLLVKGIISNVNDTNSFGWSALHCASSSGRLPAVQFLIANKADVNKRTNKGYDWDYDHTPLHFAAENDHVEVVKFLVNNGAEIMARSFHGLTPIDLAKEKGHLQIAYFLGGQVVKDEKGSADVSPSPALANGKMSPLALLSNSPQVPVSQSPAASPTGSPYTTPYHTPYHTIPPPLLLLTDSSLDSIEISWNTATLSKNTLITRIEMKVGSDEPDENGHSSDGLLPGSVVLQGENFLEYGSGSTITVGEGPIFKTSDTEAEWKEVYQGTLNRHRVTSLAPGCVYTFRGSTASSAWSSPLVARTLHVETPEAIILKCATPTSITVAWEPIPIVKKYHLELASVSSPEFWMIYEGREIEFKAEGLLPDTEYQFRVRSIFGTFHGMWNFSKLFRTTKQVEDLPKEPWEIDITEVKFERKIGRGSFGEVYLSFWAGTFVAVKKLHSELSEPDDIKDFRREVGIMSLLRHNNVVQFYGACIRGPELFVITAFMERGDLYHVLKETQVNWNLKISIAKDIAQGMLYLHTRKPPVLHRDIKSLNILIDKHWRAVIGDFGFSRVKARSLVSTMTGTPYWTAPEVLRCEPYNEKADVFSYSIVLWEVLTQQEPYYGMHPNQVIGAVAWKNPGMRPPLPHTTPGSLAARFVNLIKRCWSDDPVERPDFQIILSELEKYHPLSY